MKCNFCEENSVYKCSICGKALCPEHVRLRTVCPSCSKKRKVRYKINKATSSKEKVTIRKLVKRFWGEEEQLAFDRKFIVSKLSAYTAKSTKDVLGFVSFTETADAMLIIALGVLPQYQNSGIGRGLVEKAEAEAKKLQKKRLLVSTSNDDLPALAFYQSLGFQIYEIKPNAIAEKHGKVLDGISGLPIRDELRLQKNLS